MNDLPVEKDPSREQTWAQPVDRMKVTEVPAGAINLNVEGRQPLSPLQGFGQLWQKTFKVRLPGLELTPAQVMQAWKENFPKFQPPENRFYPPMAGIKPGEVLLINARVPAFPGSPSILPVAAGVMVLYADDTSFTVVTPEGFPEAGWNTFSVYEDDGCLVAQVQPLCRANDPMYEIFNRFLGSSAQQDMTWSHVLTSLAAHFGIQGQVSATKTLVDPRLQWSQAKNIFKNAGIRTVFYLLGTPFRWMGKMVQRRS